MISSLSVTAITISADLIPACSSAEALAPLSSMTMTSKLSSSLRACSESFSMTATSKSFSERLRASSVPTPPPPIIIMYIAKATSRLLHSTPILSQNELECAPFEGSKNIFIGGIRQVKRALPSSRAVGDHGERPGERIATVSVLTGTGIDQRALKAGGQRSV